MAVPVALITPKAKGLLKTIHESVQEAFLTVQWGQYSNPLEGHLAHRKESSKLGVPMTMKIVVFEKARK